MPLFAPLASWSVCLAATLLLAAFHSARWGWACAVIACAALAYRRAFLRWPWVPRRTILVGALRYPLAQAANRLLPAEFFALCAAAPAQPWDSHGPRAAVRGRAALLRRLIRHAAGQLLPHRRRRMLGILDRTQLVCAACGTRVAESARLSDWLQAVNASFALVSQRQDGAGTCPSCACGEFYFLYSEQSPLRDA